MKQIYILLVAMCAIAFTACSDDDNTKDPIDDDNGGEEMITAVYEPEYEYDLELNIGTFKEGENITIDWGDGGISEFTSFATDSWVWGGDELHYAIIGQGEVIHKYPNYNAHTITIKGKIKEFYCHDVLTKLDVSKCPALVNLYCCYNNISSLDVSKCSALTKLRCDENNLTSLDVSKCTALTELHCGVNNLTSLDVSKCTALTILSCGNNNLTSLNVSKCTALTELHCSSNNLTSLDISKNTALTFLNCRDNNLSASALNKIFNDLPKGKKWDEYGGQSTISIGNNLGTNTCDKSIAENKGWSVQ